MSTLSQQVRYIYAGSVHLPQWEIVITQLCSGARSVLSLPDTIEIVFDDLGPAVYGDTKIDGRTRNRITVNTSLQLRDLPPIIVHELIHLHQCHTGRLRGDGHGGVLWGNRRYTDIDALSWEEYCRLPWEADVLATHDRILNAILDTLMQENNNLGK